MIKIECIPLPPTSPAIISLAQTQQKRDLTHPSPETCEGLTMANAADKQSSASPSPAGAAAGSAAKGPSPPAQGQKDLGTEIMRILKSDAPSVDEGKQKIADIAAERKELQAARKKLTAALRNENRKRQRIRKRSQWLSDADLVEVLTMRKSKKDASSSGSRNPSAKAKAKADGTA